MQYAEEYILLGKDLSDCTTSDELKKHNSAMKKLAKLYQEVEKTPDKSFLLELLENPNQRLCVLVAAHCLSMGVYIPKAKRLLMALEKNATNPLVAFEAKMTLSSWKQQGYLRF